MEKHPEKDLYIFSYQSFPYNKSRIWNDDTKLMRGLIIDSKGKIYARPFEKFFSFRKYLSEDTVLLSEGQTTKLPDCSYKIYEKLDGALSILYWIGDTPYLSTQRSFTSIKAKKATEILHTKYSHTFKNLKKDRTYIFEAIYPESRVIIDYGNEEELVLIGTIDNTNGQKIALDESIGFKVVTDWSDKLKAVKNLSELQSLNLKNMEGFIVEYENGFRVKVKFPWYAEAHELLNKIVLGEKRLGDLEKRLKSVINVTGENLTRASLHEKFKNGEKPKEIAGSFSLKYKHVGILDWLENENQNYLSNNFNKETLDEDLNLESLFYNPSIEYVMYNRIENLKNQFE